MNSPDSKMISVLIADDHTLLVDALAGKLKSEGGFDVQVAKDAGEARAAISEHGCFDVMLLDVRMPGMDGMDSVVELSRLNEPGATAVFSSGLPADLVNFAIEQGVRGYIPKTIALKALPTAVSLVASGEVYVPHSSALEREAGAFAKSSEPGGRLTERDRLVLRLAADGKTNKEVAWHVGLSEASIKMIMRAICTKLHAKNRTHACSIARERGII